MKKVLAVGNLRIHFFYPKRRGHLGLSIMCFFVGMMIPLAASAAPIVVTNSADDGGPGTLRSAIANAANGDTIDATGLSGAITLTNGELLVTNSITITGPGPSNLAVEGTLGSPVFYVLNAGDVTISGLTITHYSFSGIDLVGTGRGIYNGNSALTLSNCTVTGNADELGGGVYNDGTIGSATLLISYSTVSSNSADSGAGLYNDGRFNTGTKITVDHSTVNNNQAFAFGGGILNVGAYSSNNPARVEIFSSTLSGNSAEITGGAINNNGELGKVFLEIQNSTFCRNVAIYFGGAILNDGSDYAISTVEIGNCIFSAGAPGGTIINMDNTVTNGATVTSLGYNMSSDGADGTLIGPGDQPNTDPLLGPLAHNGGPTKTHILWPGSPAIDAGDPAFTPPPDFDQRGSNFSRVVNGRIDIGAFEATAQKPTHESVLEQLQGIRASATNRADGKALDKIIKELTVSIASVGWNSDSELAHPKGKQVFAHDFAAAKLLTRLETDNKSGFDTTDLQVWSKSIILSDRVLAQNAIDQMSGNSSKARAALAKGDAAMTNGENISKAILSYETAWKLAASKQ